MLHFQNCVRQAWACPPTNIAVITFVKPLGTFEPSFWWSSLRIVADIPACHQRWSPIKNRNLNGRYTESFLNRTSLGFPTLRLYLKFYWYRILFYSGLCLDRFCCVNFLIQYGHHITCTFYVADIQNMT